MVAIMNSAAVITVLGSYKNGPVSCGGGGGHGALPLTVELLPTYRFWKRRRYYIVYPEVTPKGYNGKLQTHGHTDGSSSTLWVTN